MIWFLLIGSGLTGWTLLLLMGAHERQQQVFNGEARRIEALAAERQRQKDALRIPTVR